MLVIFIYSFIAVASHIKEKKNKDPKELYIAINEFNYHISKDSYDCINATYWLEWILQYETICKGQKFECPKIFQFSHQAMLFIKP